MKPEHFIREQGLDKAREVVASGADSFTFVLNDGIRSRHKSVSVQSLKRLVESLEIIETVGYDRDGAEEIYEFSKDCEVIHYAGLEIKVTRLAQAIRDHESIYGGGDE
ncbi:hypothetical protein [Acinetobacter nosocomialis]|uniref:hypothetical protein n=1 Tax=Acinetobacter nosocomialis TaxID=106654 RepID=UPI001250BE08|nr:hypothetical protein [Acinetobacter nosocomialis]